MYRKIARLIVGDTDLALSDFAKTIDPQSYLVSNDNFESEHTGTVYTSLGDLGSLKNFYDLLCMSDEIIVQDKKNKTWSDGRTEDDRYSLAWLTKHYCSLVSKQLGIKMKSCFDRKDLVDVPPVRFHDQPQIWIAGCSTTYGVGVEQDQIYWRPVVDHLQLPFENLSRSGSSVSWSADQLLRADLRPGDVVIWGITNSFRFYWYENDHSIMVNSSYYSLNPEFKNKVPEIVIVDDHWAYESINAVDRVKNICEKIGVSLLLVGLHADLDFSSHWAGYKNFIMIQGKNGLDFNSEFLDFGKDNQHPGPKTHAYYSRIILEHLTKFGLQS